MQSMCEKPQVSLVSLLRSPKCKVWFLPFLASGPRDRLRLVSLALFPSPSPYFPSTALSPFGEVAQYMDVSHTEVCHRCRFLLSPWRYRLRTISSFASSQSQHTVEPSPNFPSPRAHSGHFDLRSISGPLKHRVEPAGRLFTSLL